MKTIFAVLAALTLAFNAQAAVSGTTPGGGGSGSSTNAFTTLTNLANTGIPVLTNSSRTNLYQRPILGGAGITVSAPGGTNVLISLNIGTNDVTTVTNNTALNTVLTNLSTNNVWYGAAVKLTPTATEGAKATLQIESAAGSGVFYTAPDIGEPGFASPFATTNWVGGNIGPGKRYFVTNQSIGSATATIVRDLTQTIISVSASGGGGGSGTVTTVVDDFQTVSGNGTSTITLTSPYIPANSNFLNSVSNGLVIISNVTVGLSNLTYSVSNGLLVLSNSIPGISNGLVTVSNGLVTISNAHVGLSNLTVSISNGLLVLSNSIPAISNGLVTVSNGLVMLSNSIPTLSNGLVTVSNGMVTVSNGLTSLSNRVIFSITNSGNTNYSLVGSSNAPIVGVKSLSAGANVTLTDQLTNIVIAASGGGGSGFPLTADADFGGYASTNIIRKVISKTGGYTLSVTETGGYFDNQGTSTRVDYTLPTAAAGLFYTFYCADTDGLRIKIPAGTTVIQLSSLTTSNGTGGGYIDTTTIGNSVTLVAISSTQWVAISITGGGAWTTN